MKNNYYLSHKKDRQFSQIQGPLSLSQQKISCDCINKVKCIRKSQMIQTGCRSKEVDAIEKFQIPNRSGGLFIFWCGTLPTLPEYIKITPFISTFERVKLFLHAFIKPLSPAQTCMYVFFTENVFFRQERINTSKT